MCACRRFASALLAGVPSPRLPLRNEPEGVLGEETEAIAVYVALRNLQCLRDLLVVLMT